MARHYLSKNRYSCFLLRKSLLAPTVLALQTLRGWIGPANRIRKSLNLFAPQNQLQYKVDVRGLKHTTPSLLPQDQFLTTTLGLQAN